MKVCFFHPAFKTVGGAEVLAATQADFLKQQGVAVDVLTLEYDPIAWASWFKGISVTAMMRSPTRAKEWVHQMLPARAWRKRVWSDRALRQGSWDAVIAHNYPANAILGYSSYKGRKIWYCNEPPRWLHLLEAQPVISARTAREPNLMDPTTVEFRKRLRAWRFAQLLRGRARRERIFDIEGVRQVPEIWANSEFSRVTCKHVYGRHNVPVVYPMVRFPAHVPHRIGLDRSGLRILTHSRLVWPKNVDTVLRGFALFRTRSCPSARLDVVGEGHQLATLKRMARQLGIERAIVFHGYLPASELECVYAQCDVFALLPIDEPFGMVFPEAAARGLLLIGPDHGGPAEILDHGRLGLTVNAFAPEALADALAQLWFLDDGEVDQRRIAAEKACRSRFGRDAVGARLMHLLSYS